MINLKKLSMGIFIIGAFIIGSSNSFALTYGTISQGECSIYNGYGDEIISLSKGEAIKVVDFNEKMTLYMAVDEDGIKGLVEKEKVSIRKVREILKEDNIEVRAVPDMEAPVLKILNSGEVVNALYRTEKWYEVVLEDGTKGFVFGNQLEEKGLTLLPAKDFSIEALNKNLRRTLVSQDRPQIPSNIIFERSMLEQGSSTNKSSPWDSDSMGRNAKQADIEEISWQEASGVLARGDIATIEDVYTHKKFNIKRTFGTNHADVEALTEADTECIKEIWGGFSWERRPVIVHIEGRRWAASLAGMPHAGDTLDGVSGNGMSGVMDLHFRGSRKHKEGNITATPDPMHQAAITRALQE